MGDIFDGMTDLLDERTAALLGDVIVYAVGGAGGVTLSGFVDRGDPRLSTTGTGAMLGETRISIRRTDLPARPTSADRITLPPDAGTYAPRQVESDPSGRWWVITIKGAA